MAGRPAFTRCHGLAPRGRRADAQLAKCHAIEGCWRQPTGCKQSVRRSHGGLAGGRAARHRCRGQLAGEGHVRQAAPTLARGGRPPGPWCGGQVLCEQCRMPLPYRGAQDRAYPNTNPNLKGTQTRSGGSGQGRALISLRPRCSSRAVGGTCAGAAACSRPSSSPKCAARGSRRVSQGARLASCAECKRARRQWAPGWSR